MIVNVESIAMLNGKILSRGNTILSAGFNVIGRRIFDASYSNQIKYVMFNMTTYGKVTKATTYTETSPTVHRIEYAYTWDQSPDTWTGLHAMFANTTNDADRAATDSDFASSPINSSDVMKGIFIFTIAGNSWQSDGLKRIGHRCFNQSNSYDPINYFSFDGGTNKLLGTYGNISNTVHDLSCTIATTEASTSTRLYNGSSGTLCFNQSASRNMISGQPFKFRMTVS